MISLGKAGLFSFVQTHPYKKNSGDSDRSALALAFSLRFAYLMRVFELQQES
jgi:hypothetical protein